MKWHRAALVISTVAVVSAGLVAPASAASPTAAGSLPAAVAAPAKAKKPKTVVKNVTPFKKSGVLKMKMQAEWIDTGTCRGTFVTRAKNVYTCGGVADDLPACWPAKGQYATSMLCMRDPGDKTIYYAGEVDAAHPLPRAARPASPEPWQIVLTDGGVCSVRLGGAWDPPPDGYVWTFSCVGSRNVGALVARQNGSTLNTKTARFTARGAKAGSTRLVTVRVKKVIYAGAGPKIVRKGPSTGAACPSNATLNTLLRPLGYSLDKNFHPSCAGPWAAATVLDSNGLTGLRLFRKSGNKWIVNERPICGVKGAPAAYVVLCFSN